MKDAHISTERDWSMDNLVTATERNPGAKAAGWKLFSFGSISVTSGVTVDLTLLGPD